MAEALCLNWPLVIVQNDKSDRRGVNCSDKLSPMKEQQLWSYHTQITVFWFRFQLKCSKVQQNMFGLFDQTFEFYNCLFEDVEGLWKTAFRWWSVCRGRHKTWLARHNTSTCSWKSGHHCSRNFFADNFLIKEEHSLLFIGPIPFSLSPTTMFAYGTFTQCFLWSTFVEVVQRYQKWSAF